MGILDLFSLKGKNALITGSGQGLGAGMAIAFAQAGANVTLHNYDAVRDETIDEVKKTGVRYIARSGDVCDPAIRKMLVDDTVKEFGSIDILVNNAGTIKRAPAAEHSEEFWKTVIDTNLNSVVDQNINASEGLDGVVHQLLADGLVADIAGARDVLDAGLLDLLDSRFQYIIVAMQGYIRACLCKCDGDAGAETLRRSGNQRVFAFETKEIKNCHETAPYCDRINSFCGLKA